MDKEIEKYKFLIGLINNTHDLITIDYFKLVLSTFFAKYTNKLLVPIQPIKNNRNRFCIVFIFIFIYRYNIFINLIFL